MPIAQLTPAKKNTHTTYVTDEKQYAGPHALQLTRAARQFRSMCRHHAYTRWSDAFTEIDLQGARYLDDLGDQPAVIIANHTSHLDTVLVHAALPDAFTQNIFYGAAQDRWFAKMKRWKKEYSPLYQSFVLGTFPILRGGGADALAYAHTILERGLKVFLFPEGTRATRDALGTFKHGATLLAQRHQVPVIPLYAHGLGAIRRKGARQITPGPVSLDVLEPQHIAPTDAVEDATHALWSVMNDARQQRMHAEAAVPCAVSSAKAA